MEAEFIDQSMAEVDEAAEKEANGKYKKECDPKVAALIKRFEKENRPPDEIKKVLAGMDADRKYVHTEANMATVPGGVATNYIYRYQLNHKAQINAREPTINVTKKKKIGQLPPEIEQQIDGYAATQQLLIRHYISESEADLKGVLDGADQDVDTVGIVFLKLDWIEDQSRDPVGANRPKDFQASLSRLRRLVEDRDAGKFNEEDPEMEELRNLSDSVNKQVHAELWAKMAFQPGQMESDPRMARWNGQPSVEQISEIPRYRGFRLRSILPEDSAWDWDIFRLEEFRHSRQFSYRTYLSEHQIREFFNIPADEELVSSSKGDNRESRDDGELKDDAGSRDVEGTEKKAGKLCVWTRMDRENNKIYTWIQGSEKWLREPETPDVVTTNWFNVFPHYFNRACGRFLPVSNVTLAKPLQEEINIVQTHKRQAKRAGYDRWAVTEGLFDDHDLQEMEHCPPNGMFQTKKKIEDIQKGIFRMPGNFNPGVHDVTSERQELGAMLGQSAASQGVTRGGSDSATEAQIANQTADTTLQDHMAANERVCKSVAISMAEIINQCLPEENAKAIAGPGAMLPMIAREQLWQHLQIEIEAGSTAMPAQQKKMAQLRESVAVMKEAGIGQFPDGPRLDPVFLGRKVADILDWRDDPADFVIFPQPLMPPGAPMGGASSAPPSGPDLAPPEEMPPLPSGMPPAGPEEQAAPQPPIGPQG